MALLQARTAVGWEPEGVHLTLWGPSAVLVSWQTGGEFAGQVGAGQRLLGFLLCCSIRLEWCLPCLTAAYGRHLQSHALAQPAARLHRTTPARWQAWFAMAPHPGSWTRRLLAAQMSCTAIVTERRQAA